LSERQRRVYFSKNLVWCWLGENPLLVKPTFTVVVMDFTNLADIGPNSHLRSCDRA
jgi:hypothetical protein